MTTRAGRIVEANSELTEFVDRRTETTKHFDLGGGKFRAVVSEEPLHFKDENGIWQNFDPVAVQAGPNIAVSAAPYFATTIPNAVGFTFQVRGKPGIATVKLTEADGQAITAPVPVLEGGKCIWRDVAPDLDIELRFFEDKAELFKILKSESAPKKLQFEKTRSLDFEGFFGDQTLGWDSGRYENLPQKRAVEILRSDSDFARVGRSESQITIEEFTGRVQRIDPSTRVKSWSNDVVYPVTIDASVSVTSPTSESGYGIDGFSTAWYETNMVVGGRSVPSYIFRGGVRWTSVGIPQGATVNSAEVKLYGTAATNGSGWSVQVELENVDDAIAFSGSSRPESLSGIAAGSAAPALTSAGYFTITGLTTAFQSVINRTGWASGNAMRVALNPVGATGTYDSQYFDSTTNRPVLNIDYTAGAGPAFTSVGSFLAANNKTNQSSWSPATSAAISSGDFLIVQLATNNIATSSGATTNHSSVSVASQSMTKLREWTKSDGSADDGATISLWMLQNSSAQSSGATVTATTSANTDRWAISGWKYTVDNAGTVTEETGAFDSEAISGADAGSLATGTITSRDYLAIRSEAVEAGTGSLTPTSTWTQISGSNTSGGANPTRIGVVGEFKTGTGTSFTSDPTTRSADQAGILVALYNAISSGISGSASSSLEGVSASASGAQENTSTASSALQGVSSSGSGNLVLPVTGSASSSLQGVSSSGSANQENTSTASSSLSGVSSSASGSQDNTSTGSSSLSGISSSATGSQSLSGVVSSSLSGVSSAASGAQENTSAASSALSGVSISASGSLAINVTGSVSSALVGVSISASGAQENKSTASSALSGISSQATGSQVLSGSVSATLKSISADASGSQENSSQAISELQSVSISASGSQENTSTAISHLSGVSSSGTGSAVAGASGNVTLSGVSASASGSQELSGIGSISLQSASSSGASIQENTGAASSSLSGVSVSGSGSTTEDVAGAISSSLSGISASSSGSQELSASGSTSLEGVSITGAGAQENTITGTSQISGVSTTGAGSATQDVTGTASSSLSGVSASASASQEVSGVASSSLQGVSSSASGSVPQVVTGSISSAISGISSAASATQELSGIGSSNLLGISASGSGIVPQDVAGVGSSELSGISTSALGSITQAGTASKLLSGNYRWPSFRQSGPGGWIHKF